MWILGGTEDYYFGVRGRCVWQCVHVYVRCVNTRIGLCLIIAVVVISHLIRTHRQLVCARFNTIEL